MRVQRKESGRYTCNRSAESAAGAENDSETEFEAEKDAEDERKAKACDGSAEETTAFLRGAHLVESI